MQIYFKKMKILTKVSIYDCCYNDLVDKEDWIGKESC